MDHNVCTTITSGGPIRPKPDNTVTRKTVEEVIENLMIPYPTLSRFNTFPSNNGTDTRSSIEGVKCHHSQASFFICDDYLKIVSEKAGNFELSASGQGIKASFDVLFASPAGRTLIWSFSKKRYMTLFFTRLCRP